MQKTKQQSQELSYKQHEQWMFDNNKYTFYWHIITQKHSAFDVNYT